MYRVAAMISTSLPWQVRYEPGVPSDVPAPRFAFPSLLSNAAADAPGYPALVFFNHRYSYAQLSAEVERAAGACLRSGLQPGDRVLFGLPNGPQAVVAALGALAAGGVLVPLPGGIDGDGLARICARAEPRLALLSPRLAERMLVSRPAPPGGLVVVDPDEGLGLDLRLLRRVFGRRSAAVTAMGRAWRDWLADGEGRTLPDLAPDAPALQIHDPHSAGRTAFQFEHRHLMAGVSQLRVWLTDARPGDDTWLLLAPVGEAFGLTLGLGTAFDMRARLVLAPTVAPEAIGDILRYLRPAYVLTTGSAVQTLVARPELARMDLRSVRAWITGDDVGAATAAAFEAATGLELCQGFAPPGTAGLATCNPINGKRVAGSVGLPMPGVDLRLGQGLELAGPNLACDGWLAAARRARVDEAGFLYIGSSRP